MRAATVATPVSAQELYRFFDAGEEQVLALRGVTLSVRAGEAVAVVGPSGSGKSTLLACLAGLNDPDGGTVHLAGQRMSRQPERVRSALRAAHVGLVYQNRNLLGHLTVEQNVRLAQQLAPPALAHARRRQARDVLSDLRIDHRRTSYPRTLSGGESARTALAVALANAPSVLIADEPTGELDQQTEAAVLDLLAREVERGMAVVIASHSSAVERVVDRVLVMADGTMAA
jgi:putative ABC transport system ATP-binding protein